MGRAQVESERGSQLLLGKTSELGEIQSLLPMERVEVPSMRVFPLKPYQALGQRALPF